LGLRKGSAEREDGDWGEGATATGMGRTKEGDQLIALFGGSNSSRVVRVGGMVRFGEKTERIGGYILESSIFALAISVVLMTDENFSNYWTRCER